VGYGGAAGGGKSAAMLMSALQFVDVPKYHALLLRRTFADLNLPESLIPLSHEWLSGTDAKWLEQKHQWRFPSGATLTFGYCENERDIYRYQSSAFAFVGWDELTQFTRTQYLYLFSRLRRRQGLPVPLRFRAATNPGGEGHDWVLSRFFVPVGNTWKPVWSERRKFIPALLEDNPFLDRETYEESLSELDHVTRAQLRHGDWNIRPDGLLFKREWFKDKLIDQPPECKRVVRFWDLAGTVQGKKSPDPDYTAGVKMGLDRDGGFVVLDVQEFRATPADVRKRIALQADIDGRGVEVFIEQEPGQSGKDQLDNYRRVVLPGFAVYGVKATGDKITRAKPFSAACENGLVRLLRGAWNGLFLDRLTGFGLPGVHDDVTDAADGAHSRLTKARDPWDADRVRRAFDGPGKSLDGDDEDMSVEARMRRMLNVGDDGIEME
jgi:predicted phage terminase large subunit-like protein